MNSCAQAAFIATAPFSPNSSTGYVLQTLGSSQYVSRHFHHAVCTKCERRLSSRSTQPVMSSRRRFSRQHRRYPSSKRPFGLFEDALQSAQIRWDTASSNERIMLLFIATAIAGGVGLAFNILMHLAAFAAFLAFPVFMLPLTLLAASFGIVALTFVGVTGASLFFLGSPILVGGALLTKVIAPFVFVALLAKTFSAVRSSKGSARSSVLQDSSLDDLDIKEEISKGSNIFDAFSEFDRELALRTRSAFRTTGSSNKVDDWTVHDCVRSLQSAGLTDAARIFLDERIDGHVLTLMSDDEIERELGGRMTLGDRKRLLFWARNLRG